MKRIGGLAMLAVSVLALAACGGSDGAPGAGADLVPASAAFAVVANTDFDSGQWEAANGLIEKFPGGRGGIRGLFAMQDNVDFEQDVEPALGPEVVVAGVEAAEQSVVLLTQPDDPAKFERLAAMGDTPAVTRELSDGWWAAARSAGAIDRLEQARGDGESLGESDAWTEATGGLPEETLATVYVAASSAATFENADLPPEAASVLACLGGDEPSPAGFAVVAEEDGVRLEGSAGFPQGYEKPDEAASELAGVLPGGALGFYSIRSLGSYLREAVRCATERSDELQTQLAQVELGLGLSLEEDLFPLLAGEAAVGVYAGQGATPSVVVATQVEDETAALATVDKVMERARLVEPGLSVEEASVDGLAARHVSVGGQRVVSYGAVDGILGFATAETGLAALGGDEPPLADDAEYQAARDAAGAPAEEAGFLYLDGRRIVQTLAGVLVPNDLPLDVSSNLEPLRSLLLWGAVRDERATVEGFVRID